MSDVWDERKKSLEEEYFRRKEQEAIEKLRAKRRVPEEEAPTLNCPSCGGILVEVTYEGISIARCNKCSEIESVVFNTPID